MYGGVVFVNRNKYIDAGMENERHYGWGMKIMTAIIDSKTLDIIYIGLILLYSIYVIREKKIVLSDQKYFIRHLPMNYLEFQIGLNKSY